MHQMFSTGDRSGLQAGQFSSWTLLLRSYAVVIAAVCGFALSCWNTRRLEGSICCSKTFIYLSAFIVPSITYNGAEDHLGGADGPEDHGRDWDLGNTETHETDRASMAENTKKSSIDSQTASIAVTGQDEDSQTALHSRDRAGQGITDGLHSRDRAKQGFTDGLHSRDRGRTRIRRWIPLTPLEVLQW